MHDKGAQLRILHLLTEKYNATLLGREMRARTHRFACEKVRKLAFNFEHARVQLTHSSEAIAWVFRVVV
jgi:hypothetical protein